MKALYVILIVVSLFGTSCMMMGSSGGGCMSHGSSHAEQTMNQSVIAQFDNANIKCVLNVPPLTMGKESELTVTANDKKTGAALSGAKVTFSMIHDQTMSMHDESDAIEKKELEASESSMKGMYVLKHVFDEHGSFKISVTVTEKQGSGEPISLSVIAEVAHSEGAHSGGSHSRGGLSPIFILGGIGMIIMMGVMIGRFAF